MKNGSFSHNLKAGVARFTSARRRMLCVLSLLAVLIFVGTAAASVVFVLKWGSQGTGDGQFNQPVGVALNSTGQVYVTDLLNNRIQKFDANGGFLTQWGSPGSGAGQFNVPFGVAVDSAGNVYVADPSGFGFGSPGRIQKFDANGAFLSSIDNFLGVPFVPIDVAVGPSGSIYVVGLSFIFGPLVMVFDAGGAPINYWGGPGSGDGQFGAPLPAGIAVDSSGNVYVADYGNNRVQKFDANGAFLTKWGSFGTGDGQFNQPIRVAVDSSGNVYVTDDFTPRVQKFDSNGNFIEKWGSQGNGDGEFNEPAGIAVNSSGDVYVADQLNHRVQKFRPPTSQEATQTLIGQVNGLVPSVLTSQKANTLTNKLDSAINQLNKGNIGSACTHLQDFINSVNAYIGNGTLTSAQGQPLIDAANAIKTSIGC